MHAARGGPSCCTGALWLAPIPPTKLHADGAARRANHAHRAIDGCDRTSQTAGRLAIKRRTDTTCNTTSLSLASVRSLPSAPEGAEGTSRSWGDAGAFELHFTSHVTPRTTIATIVPLLKVQGTIHTLTHSRSRCLASPGTSLASSLYTQLAKDSPRLASRLLSAYETIHSHTQVTRNTPISQPFLVRLYALSVLRVSSSSQLSRPSSLPPLS